MDNRVHVLPSYVSKTTTELADKNLKGQYT